MKQKRILIPTQFITSWKSLLAEPDKQWRTGYSAMMTAQSWETAGGLPPEIKTAFAESEGDYFNNLELLIAIPEYKTDLKGGRRPSQSDVFVLLRSDKGLIAVTVEAKAREDFGPTMAQWRNGVSDEGYTKRLRHIMENTGLEKSVPDHTRYQLLHRTASAVIEAKRFHCNAAVMLVQSFVESDAENNFEGYADFIGLYGAAPLKDEPIFLADIDGVKLFSAWVYTPPAQA